MKKPHSLVTCCEEVVKKPPSLILNMVSSHCGREEEARLINFLGLGVRILWVSRIFHT